jgi:DNA polymerase III epsilon subunit-like protein
MQITPYETKNLIFLDTEFTSLDPTNGQILSIGIVKLNGEELYLELETAAPRSDWVKKHLILDQEKVSTDQAKQAVTDFLGDADPFAVAFVDNYDNLYMVKLFGEGKLPFKWLTIDMASILFAHGINPKSFLPNETAAKSFYKSIGVDMSSYRQHHALDDAKLLREVWLKLTVQ